MAYTTIDDPSAHFTTTLYTGNASTNAITNSANAGDFQPDWVWLKSRNSATHHRLYDTSRGALKNLISSATNSEATTANSLTSFDSNGFTLGSDDNSNQNTKTFVAWQWKCNGGTTSSNSNGSITSTVQVNDTAGFSIVLYTGNETAGATIGHGLSAAPDVIIVKNRDTNRTWLVGHQSYVNGGNSENVRLNSTGGPASADSQAKSGWNRTVFGSSTFTVGNGIDGDFSSSTNNGTDDHVAYCFREIKGYSKFGSYTGNGSTNGTFVYTGFKPAFIIIRPNATFNWLTLDNKRDPINPLDTYLYPNLSNAEASDTSYHIDFLSNGFKFRGTQVNANQNGTKYFYFVWAEHPFVSSKGVPVTAR